MIKGIIFDFNWTLYMPEQKEIPLASIDLLSRLKDAGYAMALVSKIGPGREDICRRYNLSSFFSVQRFAEYKDQPLFTEILERLGLNPDEIVAVGDRIRSEIAVAKSLGMQAIWYRNGRFKDEIPRNDVEKPDHIIEDLKDILRILGVNR